MGTKICWPASINKIFIKVESTVPLCTDKDTLQKKKILTVFRFEILQSTFDEIFLRIPGTVFWKGIEPRPLGTILSTCPLQCINGVSQIPSWSVQEGTLWQLFWKIVQLIWLVSWIKKNLSYYIHLKNDKQLLLHLF